MQLGIIGWVDEESFRKAKQRELEFIELDVNDRVDEFFANIDKVKEYSARYEIAIAGVGRWGSNRIVATGINEEELALECRLVDATKELGSSVYITGCNYVESEQIRIRICRYQ